MVKEDGEGVGVGAGRGGGGHIVTNDRGGRRSARGTSSRDGDRERVRTTGEREGGRDRGSRIGGTIDPNIMKIVNIIDMTDGRDRETRNETGAGTGPVHRLTTETGDDDTPDRYIERSRLLVDHYLCYALRRTTTIATRRKGMLF